MSISRRQILVGGAALSVMRVLELGWGGKSFASEGFGPLVPDPNGLLDLPAGFSYRVFGRAGDPMYDLKRQMVGLTPGAHDGMAAFVGPRGTTILVRNHELGPSTSDNGIVIPTAQRYDAGRSGGYVRGGTTTLVVDKANTLVASWPSLGGTSTNCAGGPTPWGSWVTCEETTRVPETDPLVQERHGYTFEVAASATSPVEPIPLTAMGRFSHEALCVDPATGFVYETEDSGTSLFYRFRPREPGNLGAGGVLEAMALVEFPEGVNTASRDVGLGAGPYAPFEFPAGREFEVEWVPIERPDWGPGEESCQEQGRRLGAAVIRRGEGIWWSANDQAAYVVSTNGGVAGRGQIFRYAPNGGTRGGGTFSLHMEAPAGVDSGPEATWAAPDNITVAPWGDLVLCEDGGGEEFLWMVSKNLGVFRFARNAVSGGEFAGACFARNGRTLFVNIQSPGMTFAITGPFRPLHSMSGY
jgi:secreted PhoX family phosphatase